MGGRRRSPRASQIILRCFRWWSMQRAPAASRSSAMSARDLEAPLVLGTTLAPGNLRTHLDKQSHGEAMAEWKGTSSSNGAPHATLIETVSGKLIAEDSNFFSGLVADVGEGILQCTATDCQHGEKAFVFVGKGKMLRNTWNLESNVRQHFQSRAKVGHTNISALKLTTCHQ